MATLITKGIITRMHHAQAGDEELYRSGPVVQLLSVKSVTANPQAGNGPAERFRLILSDGEFYVQAMLATQINSLVHNEEIVKHSIIQLEQFTSSSVKGKRLFIVLKLKVIQRDAEKVGSPDGFDKVVDGASAQPTPAPGVPVAAAPAAAPAPAPAVKAQASAPAHQALSNKPSAARRPTYPIESLSPYQNNWTIKARVIQKSEVKRWSNARGEGHLFNVTLMDETGEIRGTAFNAVADELYEKLQEGNVYYVSKARVNLAKKKFSSVNNDYELSFEKNTEVEECRDTTDVPQVKYNFVELANLESLEKDATCDVIGVVKEVGELGSITSQKTSKTIPKRELTLVDRTGYSVRLTLWGKQAEEWSAFDTPIIAVKGAKVGDFGGRSLSMYSSSTMAVNPDIVDCHALRGWYDAVGANESFRSHTTGGAGGGGGGFRREELRTLADVREANLGQEKAEYFSTRATVSHIKSDPLAYPACPGQNGVACNKKVNQIGDDWRCEKCDRSYPAPEYRYLMSFAASDYTGQVWLQGFNEVGVAMFNMSANELQELKDRDESKFNAVVQNAESTTWNFSCRAKQDTYNDQVRVRYGVTRLQPVNFREEATYLRDLLMGPWGQ